MSQFKPTRISKEGKVVILFLGQKIHLITIPLIFFLNLKHEVVDK